MFLEDSLGDTDLGKLRPKDKTQNLLDRLKSVTIHSKFYYRLYIYGYRLQIKLVLSLLCILHFSLCLNTFILKFARILH